MLEPLRAFQLAAENQTVQAGFVDDGRMLFSTHGVAKRYPISLTLILLVNVLCKSVFRVDVPKCRRNVLSNKPRVVVNEHNADFAKLGVVEDFDVLRQRKLH